MRETVWRENLGFKYFSKSVAFQGIYLSRLLVSLEALLRGYEGRRD